MVKEPLILREIIVTRSMAKLLQGQIFQLMSSQWNEIKTERAARSDMEGFLQHFLSTIRTSFHTKVSMKQLKNFFIVSNRQACVVRGVLDKKVHFRAIEGALYSSQKDRDFDKICGRLFEVLSKTQGWHSYLALKSVFRSIRKNNPDLHFLRVAPTDVLQRLIKLNVIEIKHCMLPIVNMTTNT